MENLDVKYLEQKQLSNKEIIFMDVNSNFNQIKKKINQNKNILVISFDYKSHKKLNDEKIKHKISDKFINDLECNNIQDYVYKFNYWFDENEFSNLLIHKGVNIGRLYQDELLNFFVRFLKKFKEVENIFTINQETIFFADNELYKIINFFTKSCTKIEHSNDKLHAFTHEQIKIGLKIGKKQKNIFINEKKYLKFKNVVDQLINSFFKPRKIQKEKSNILFVEYNTDRFKELFLKSREYNFQIFFYGRKRPPFWNFSTLKTIINSKCKIITEKFIYDQTTETNYFKSNEHMKNQISELWKKNTILEKFFTFEEKNIFELIKPVLIELIENRLAHTVKEIELAHRMFEKIKIDYSVVINEVGFYEQIISSLSKKFNVNCIHMQEGYHWDVKEVHQNHVSQGVYLHDAQKLLVWGNIDREMAMNNALIPSEKIGIIGAPRYDELFGLKSKKEDYILLASSADPQPEEVEGLRVQKIEKYLSDILEICKVVSELEEKLIVKLHPSPTQLTNLEELTSRIDPEINILSSGDITELLPNAKILICIGISSTMIEAIILGKPVIFIPGIDYNYKNPSVVELNGCLTSNIKNVKDDLLKILHNEKIYLEIQNLSNNYLKKLIDFQGNSSKKFYEFLKK